VAEERRQAERGGRPQPTGEPATDRSAPLVLAGIQS